MKTRSRADLHMHTSCSDGWPSPSELVTHVITSTDLRVIAVTDHDTLEGALRAADRAAKTGGIEVLLEEKRVYKPSPDFAKKAHIKSLAALQTLRRQALNLLRNLCIQPVQRHTKNDDVDDY